MIVFIPIAEVTTILYEQELKFNDKIENLNNKIDSLNNALNNKNVMIINDTINIKFL